MIELRNVSKQYQEGTMVLNQINLCIEEGDYVAIMGPSGAGKTTLMNVIGCLDGTTEGEYLLDGENILEYSEKQKARLRNEKIGFVVQDFGLIPSMSVYKNVRIPLLYSKRKMKNERKHIQDLLRQLKVLDKIDEKVHRLSGGQQQRVR